MLIDRAIPVYRLNHTAKPRSGNRTKYLHTGINPNITLGIRQNYLIIYLDGTYKIEWVRGPGRIYATGLPCYYPLIW